MKKLLIFVFLIISFCSVIYADEFVIIPESGQGSSKSGGGYTDPDEVAQQAVKEVTQASAGSLWSKYNEKAKEMDDNIGAQIASGIMTWDTLLNYVIYIIKFLSQAGLVVGAASIIFGGYKYGLQVFTGNAQEGSRAIKFAIIGVLIIIFSYGIMKILLGMFIE